MQFKWFTDCLQWTCTLWKGRSAFLQQVHRSLPLCANSFIQWLIFQQNITKKLRTWFQIIYLHITVLIFSMLLGDRHAHYELGLTPLVLVWKDVHCCQYLLDTDSQGNVPAYQQVWISIITITRGVVRLKWSSLVIIWRNCQKHVKGCWRILLKAYLWQFL